MARDLDNLKDDLWTQFEDAVKRHPKYEDATYTSSSMPYNPSIENRKAMADLAKALIGLEQEQRLQRQEKTADEERKNGIKMPGKQA